MTQFSRTERAMRLLAQELQVDQGAAQVLADELTTYFSVIGPQLLSQTAGIPFHLTPDTIERAPEAVIDPVGQWLASAGAFNGATQQLVRNNQVNLADPELLDTLGWLMGWGEPADYEVVSARPISSILGQHEVRTGLHLAVALPRGTVVTLEWLQEPGGEEAVTLNGRRLIGGYDLFLPASSCTHVMETYQLQFDDRQVVPRPARLSALFDAACRQFMALESSELAQLDPTLLPPLLSRLDAGTVTESSWELANASPQRLALQLEGAHARHNQYDDETTECFGMAASMLYDRAAADFSPEQMEALHRQLLETPFTRTWLQNQLASFGGETDLLIHATLELQLEDRAHSTEDHAVVAFRRLGG